MMTFFGMQTVLTESIMAVYKVVDSEELLRWDRHD